MRLQGSSPDGDSAVSYVSASGGSIVGSSTQSVVKVGQTQKPSIVSITAPSGVIKSSNTSNFSYLLSIGVQGPAGFAGATGASGPQGPAGSVPVRFSSPTAVLGVSPTDYCYAPRTLTGARMRVASAPSGSPLTVEVQHWNSFSWSTLGTLSIAAGSITEAVVSFSQSQSVGNLVRINCTSAGSLSPATGVSVDVVT